MAFKKEIRDLARFTTLGQGYVSKEENKEYTKEEVREALNTFLKSMTSNIYDFERNKLDLYELLSENIDVIIPVRVEATLGQFAEIKTLQQGQKATFKKKLGRMRAKQFVGRVSPSGIYETFRLDSTTFDVAVHAIGGGIRIDWERYLDGSEDWNELLNIMLDAIEMSTYQEIAMELQGSYQATGRPSNTKYSGAYSAVEMRNLLDVVRNYGESAIIFAPWQFVAKMAADIAYVGTHGAVGSSVSAADVEALRTTGFIGIFHGAPIVSLPNTFTDETNLHYQLNPSVAYIMPAGGEKVVKVAFEGQTQITDIKAAGDNSMEMMVYKKVGSAILYTNNWAIYQNTSLNDSDWTTIA